MDTQGEGGPAEVTLGRQTRGAMEGTWLPEQLGYTQGHSQPHSHSPSCPPCAPPTANRTLCLGS